MKIQKKIKKKIGGGGSGQGGGSGWGGWGGQGGWERRTEAFVKIQFFYFFLGGGGWGVGLGGQGGCKRRSKVFVRIQKKNLGGGVRVGGVGG